MPALCDLPQEIRDEIICLVIHSPIPIPKHTLRYRSPDYGSWPNGNRVFQPDTKATHQCIAFPLLLTNRQIRHDTLKCLKRTRLPFVLDLAIVDRHWVWPTWRIIPPRNAVPLQELHVNIIMASTVSYVKSEPQQPWVSLAASTSPWERWVLDKESIWGVLLRFLDIGPLRPAASATVGHLSKPRSQMDLRIKVVYLDIDSSRCQHGGNPRLSESDVPLRSIDGMAHLGWDPLYRWDLSDSKNYLMNLLCCLHTHFSQKNESRFDTFLERVGMIVARIDGKTEKVLDLTSYVTKAYTKRPNMAKIQTKRWQNEL